MDLSKLPDSQRQELEQLHKQFHQHLHQQQQSASTTVQPPPQSAYDPFQIHQSYDPSYYYNYQNPSQLPQSSHHQYDALYYQTYYSNSYQQPHQQQQPHTQSETPVGNAASNEQRKNEESGSGSAGLGQVQLQPNLGLPGFPGINPAAAAAAMAALSQLTQFAGAMTGGEHHGQGHFRLPVFVREQALRFHAGQ